MAGQLNRHECGSLPLNSRTFSVRRSLHAEHSRPTLLPHGPVNACNGEWVLKSTSTERLFTPKIEIQQSMLRSYHVFAKSHPLISVTFSTPTGDFTSLRRLFAFSSLDERALSSSRGPNHGASLPEWPSKYLHRWVTSEDFARQRLRPDASGCASNPVPQKEGRQASRSVRKR